MNINIKAMVPVNFNDDSRVWIYQSNRSFSEHEARQIEELLRNFNNEWRSNGIPVKGYTKLFFRQFLVFMVDETNTVVTNTDSLLRFLKNIELDFEIELLNRLILAFIMQERVQLLPLDELNNAIEKDFIIPETLYFNNTILTKKELLNNWVIPAKESWLGTRISELNEVEMHPNNRVTP